MVTSRKKNSTFMQTSIVNMPEVSYKSGFGEAEGESAILQVGNYLVDMDRVLGSGEFGTVYLAQQIPEEIEMDEDDKKT